MQINKILKALKDHYNEEKRIHKELFKQSDKGVVKLAKKHLKDNLIIHKDFWQQLKKAFKE
jgi:hypothetical protein